MNQQFVIENSGVNASSCEFLEHLIISLEQNINLVIILTIFYYFYGLVIFYFHMLMWVGDLWIDY
jgi:hypothetical protein